MGSYAKLFQFWDSKKGCTVVHPQSNSLLKELKLMNAECMVVSSQQNLKIHNCTRRCDQTTFSSDFGYVFNILNFPSIRCVDKPDGSFKNIVTVFQENALDAGNMDPSILANTIPFFAKTDTGLKRFSRI